MASGGLLAMLTDGDRADLLAAGRRRRYRPGSLLFAEGDHSDHVVVLIEGRVKVFCTTTEGHEPWLGVRGPGEVLGDMAALDDAAVARVASVVALEPVVTHELAAAQFRAFVADHPAAALGLLRVLIARLRGADRRRIDFGGYDTAHRLTRILAELADEHGVPNGDGVDVPFSQQELASMIGASRESVARALATLRDDGLVRTARRGVTVVDVDRLRAAAG